MGSFFLGFFFFLVVLVLVIEVFVVIVVSDIVVIVHVIVFELVVLVLVLGRCGQKGVFEITLQLIGHVGCLRVTVVDASRGRKLLAISERGTPLAPAGCGMSKKPENARVAGLRYRADSTNGIRRVRAGSTFRYTDHKGRPIRDERTVRRIKSLAIPPAWTDVWISPDPRSHLQATGRDARGRKQYRYHPKWREVSHQTKYSRMAAFARALPHIRRQVSRHLRLTGLCRERVLATVVQLLEKTFMRIGNEEYARDNGSFGLTTLRDRHVKVRGQAIRFEFKGKSGIRHSLTLSDARLARIIKRCQELAGQELFQYVGEDGRRRSINSSDVNSYLREAAGETFSAKDFRTWAGTLIAARALRNKERGDSERKSKSIIVEAVKVVSGHLGNTPAVCRACYIHPAVLEAYADGTLASRLARARKVRGLSAEEAAVLAVLETQKTWKQQLEAAARIAKAA